ncbi:hypothetical protein AgCh_023793 [Apium graveolens]
MRLYIRGEKDSIIRVSQGESTSEGEKVLNIQVSKVIIPAIAFTKPPAIDNIYLIKIAAVKLESNDKLKKLDVAAVELELNEKWKKLDENIKKKFGTIGKQDKPKENYPKNSDKNTLDLMYETPKPDEEKLLGRSIAFCKDTRDTESKKRIAKIYINDAKNLAKKPIITEAYYPAVTKENLIKEKKEKQKQPKRNFRYKLPAKRKLDFSEDKEECMPTQSITSSQPAIPTLEDAEFKVDPNITFHGEPVISTNEPIDWDNLPLLDLNIPIYAKPRKIKKRVVKMVKPVKLQSKLVAKPKPIVNKGDQLFICDIKEFSNINLYLEEINDVKAIDS